MSQWLYTEISCQSFGKSGKLQSKKNMKNKKNRLKLPMMRTKTFGTRAFTYAAPAIWNSSLDNIKNRKFIETFKRLL